MYINYVYVYVCLGVLCYTVKRSPSSRFLIGSPSPHSPFPSRLRGLLNVCRASIRLVAKGVYYQPDEGGPKNQEQTMAYQSRNPSVIAKTFGFRVLFCCCCFCSCCRFYYTRRLRGEVRLKWTLNPKPLNPKPDFQIELTGNFFSCYVVGILG